MIAEPVRNSVSRLRCTGVMCLCILTVLTTAIGQEDEIVQPLPYSQHELKRMTKVDVTLESADLPRMYLMGSDKSGIEVMRVPTSQVMMKPKMINKHYNYDEIKHIVILDRKHRHKMGLIGGGVGAVLGTALGFAITKEKADDDHLILLGQTTEQGFFEPVAGAVVGFGVGFVLGEFLSPIKISPGQRGFKSKLNKFTKRRP